VFVVGPGIGKTLVYYFKEHDVIAKVQYKIKAVLDVHGRDLICKQHLYIHERLDMSIVPRHHSKSKEVLTLCCIPRGKNYMRIMG